MGAWQLFGFFGLSTLLSGRSPCDQSSSICDPFFRLRRGGHSDSGDSPTHGRGWSAANLEHGFGQLKQLCLLRLRTTAAHVRSVRCVRCGLRKTIVFSSRDGRAYASGMCQVLAEETEGGFRRSEREMTLTWLTSTPAVRSRASRVPQVQRIRLVVHTAPHGCIA